MTMFDIPKKTLLQSLNTLLERPKEYLADVCFVFESIEIWAHRAIILARAPKELIERYFPELRLATVEKKQIRIDMNDNAVKISVQLFRSLLRFWYTATYYPTSSSSNILVEEKEEEKDKKTQEELEKLGIRLGTAVLPLHCESVPDVVQLVNDLKEMRQDKMTADVKISVTGIEFTAHKCILAAQSAYFYALFCTEFQESSTQKIEFNQDLFNEAILDLILTFFYTDKVIVGELKYKQDRPFSFLQRKLQQQKHALRVIQKAFYAADYLGHDETLGRALLCEMERMCHQFKCACLECAALLPSMLAWSDKHVEVVPKLRRTLILFYSDPVHSLPLLWSQRPFALLVTTFVPNTLLLGQNTLESVLKGEALFRERTPKTFIHDILERLFCNITKHNAIHVLHSLHLCQSHIRTVDPKPTWSRPTLDLVKPVLEYTVDKICQSLDFYCGEYPILLSCVDGIGAGFSIDFLDFLLRHVLFQGINHQNAGVIYQVIVRDLSGRQEVVKNMAIDDVLIKARKRCATFIGQHWNKIKAQGGFNKLDKSTLRLLAEDIHIPYRNLTNKPYYESSNLFSSFSSKKSFNNNNNKKVLPEDKNALLNKVYTRRLSLGNLMTKSSRTLTSRPRALSTETVSSMTRYNPPTPVLIRTLENPPLINLLSQETDERRKALEEAEDKKKIKIRPPSFRLETNRPLLRTSSSFTSLTDQLLPIEGIETIETTTNDIVLPRPTRLKFELPTAPARSKSPNRNLPYLVPSSAETLNNNFLSPTTASVTTTTATIGGGRSRRGSKSRIRKTRWSMGSDVSDEEENTTSLPALGNKIELLRRPLPTMGTIKYIGPVQFAEGTYIGVELESRLGKSDGSVDGVRYFFTDPQRALFVKPDDFKII